MLKEIKLDSIKKHTILSEEQIKKIEGLFKVEIKKSEENYFFKLKNEKNNSEIAIEIFKTENEYLISVFAINAHLQLQSCNYFIISEMLEELIFISENGDKISGLIISKQGDCSLYSNVNRAILNADFSELNSEKLLAAVALSVVDSIE